MRRATTRERAADFLGCDRGPVREATKTGLRVAEKSVAEDAERAGGIAEGAGGFQGGTSLDIVRAEGLILALSGVAGFAEKRRWVC